MSRRSSFRNDTNLQKELRRVNKLVQNKQSRLRVNKQLEVQDVETTKFKEFKSRRETEKYLKQMSKFLEKSADFRVMNEKGANLQYSEVQEIERTISRVNKQKKEQWNKVKDLDFTHKGTPTGLTVGQQADPTIGIGDPKYQDFKPIKFNPSRFRTEKEFRAWAKEKEQVYSSDWLDRQNNLYRDNYLKSMENNLGSLSKELQEHIRNMSLDEFITKYYTENNAHINFIYDRLGVQTRIQELERVWGV